jgi:hypothetical protein
LIDLYEAHKNNRDKFEILAFHDGTVKDFAELDKNLESPRKRFWRGRDLPFPILLDATGETVKNWGIHAFPTTLLIDPEGKLVGEAREEELEEKLPPLPMSVRVARALDRSVGFSVEDATLVQSVSLLSTVAHVPIRLDTDRLKEVGVTPETRVPFQMSGMVSLRSALNLLLAADGLMYEQDDKGLVIRGRKAGATPVGITEGQRATAKRIEQALDQKVDFDFKDKPLVEALRFFEGKTQENFVLDPRDRKAGLFDRKMTVSGSGKGLPLRQALQRLLDPVGVQFTVRDEVIVLAAKPRTTPDK